MLYASINIPYSALLAVLTPSPAERTRLSSTTAQAVRNSASLHYLKYYIGAQSVTLPELLPGIGGTRTWQLEELAAALNTCAGVASLCGVPRPRPARSARVRRAR